MYCSSYLLCSFHRDVDYSQLTTLQEGVRRLEIKSYDSSSGVQSYRRLQTGLDCTTGYDVVFENWWDTVESGGAGPVEVTPVLKNYTDFIKLLLTMVKLRVYPCVQTRFK